MQGSTENVQSRLRYSREAINCCCSVHAGNLARRKKNKHEHKQHVAKTGKEDESVRNLIAMGGGSRISATPIKISNATEGSAVRRVQSKCSHDRYMALE